jgi:hypothetical protein
MIRRNSAKALAIAQCCCSKRSIGSMHFLPADRILIHAPLHAR